MVKTTDKILLGVLVLALIGMSAVFITALSPTESPLSGNAVHQEQSTGDIMPDEAIQIALNTVPGVFKELEIDNNNGVPAYEVEVMSGESTYEVVVSLSGDVISFEEEEIDTPITGTPLELASQAALDYLGEGRVTDTEIGDEEGFYEIEVTLDNGEEVDVHLDENFRILSVED
jgi:uncharacterized membrane protein YkoI